VLHPVHPSVRPFRAYNLLEIGELWKLRFDVEMTSAILLYN